MILYEFLSSIGLFIFSYFIWILESLGYPGITFEETDTTPWFVEWPILIWIIITMFISIIMMVKRAVRSVIHAYRTMTQ